MSQIPQQQPQSQSRQPLPPPSQDNHLHTNQTPTIPATFHVAKYFTRNVNNTLFIGQFNVKSHHIVKFICRCVAKYIPQPLPNQQPPQIQSQHLIFQDISGSWNCVDSSIAQWCQIGDLCELYCTLTIPQHYNPQVQFEPFIHPLSIKILTPTDDEVLQKCSELLNNMELNNTVTNVQKNNSLYQKAHPTSYFPKLQHHLDQCRIWYANNGYTAEYVQHILKRKQPYMLELENPYYVIPLTQNGLNDGSKITLDHSTRRLLYSNQLDVTDRLVCRVLHIKATSQCPHSQSQYCTPECIQCVVDDNSAQQPTIVTSTKVYYSAEEIAHASVIPDPPGLETLIRPVMQKSYDVAPVYPQSTTASLPPPPGSGPTPYPPMGGYPSSGMGSYPSTNIPQQGYPTNVPQQGYPSTQYSQQPQSTTSTTSSTSHFDIYRYTYIPAPKQGETVMLYTQLSFPTAQNATGQLVPIKTDIIYNVLTKGYCEMAMSDQFKMFEAFYKYLPTLYADINCQNSPAAFGAYFNYLGERHVAKDGVNALYTDDPKLFIVDQKMSKSFLRHHKDRFLNVTLDQLNHASPYGKKQYKDWLDQNPGVVATKSVDTPDWCIKYKNFTTAPLSTPGTIVTTTGYIACHNNVENIAGFQIFDGSQYPMEFLAGKHYPYPAQINSDVRFPSNRTMNAPKTLPTVILPTNTPETHKKAPTPHAPSVGGWLNSQTNKLVGGVQSQAPKLALQQQSVLSVSSNQNSGTAFSLSAGFTHQSVIKFWLECKIDATNPNPAYKDQIFHFNIIAYEILPCTSFQQRDQYVVDNVQRANCDNIYFIQPHLQAIPDAQFGTHLIANPSFLYTPSLATPIEFAQLGVLKDGLIYLASRSGYTTADARSLHRSKLHPNRVYTSTSTIKVIQTKYDYNTSSHTNNIKSVDLLDYTGPGFNLSDGIELRNVSIGSENWPQELKRYSTVQWFFTLDPTSNHRQVKMLLLGYKILRICSTEQGETTASTDFQQIAKKATDAHLVYWDEAVARNVARTVCPDFAAAGDDKSSIPAMF